MKDNTIVLISSGLTEAKKEYNPFNRMNRYLNYGLLGLATILKNKGYTVKMFQGEYDSPFEIIDRIKNSGIKLEELEYPVLLSIPSYYSISWAKSFCELLKSKYSIKIVGGGRWVIGDSEKWIKSKIPDVDLWVSGLADDVIENAIHSDLWDSIHKIKDDTMTNCFDELDYTLLFDYKNYQPSIEVSRGCGRGCSFCMEKDIPISSLKPPEMIIKQLKNAINMYQSEDINFYFEASLFLPSLSWARQLRAIYTKELMSVRWRCESRVDALKPEIIHELAHAGLKVIDLGLESASIRQLKAMKKAKKPEDYLEKAKTLIEACHEEGVDVKVNILLFAGESLDSVAETKEWIQANIQYIKGVSVNPVVAYGPENDNEYFISLGASIIDTSELLGYSYMNLSVQIDYPMSISLSNQLSQSLMNQEDYFYLKKFSYFPRSYQYSDFLEDVKKANKESLPFKIFKGDFNYDFRHHHLW